MYKFEEETTKTNSQEELKADESIIIDTTSDDKESKVQEEKNTKKVKKEENAPLDLSSNDKNDKVIQNKIFVSDDSNHRRSALFNAESDLYRVKFDEYAGIPDCIVNEIFEINDGKGKISIEEAIIMLMNLIPTAKNGINEAKTIEDAIYVSRIKIAAFLYKECTFGFNNIPEHSRVNLSNKIKADCEKNLVFDVLYDYQLMRLSGYLPLG